MCVHIYIYIHTYTSFYTSLSLYIYIYTCRERDVDTHMYTTCSHFASRARLRHVELHRGAPGPQLKGAEWVLAKGVSEQRVSTCINKCQHQVLTPLILFDTLYSNAPFANATFAAR